MPFRYNTTLLFLFTFFLLCSCKGKIDPVVQKQIEKAIEIGEGQPKEALSILDSIPNPHELGEANFMLYQIADVRANRNLDRPISQQQTKLISKAAAFFEKEKDKKNALLANYYSAVAYHSQSDVEQELTHFLRANAYAEALNDSLMMGKTLYNISVMYYDQQVYDSAVVYLQEALPLFRKYPEIQVRAYRLLALTYYQKDNFKAALENLDKGAPLLKVDDNAKFAHLYNMLYAVINKRTGKYEKSADYLRKNILDTQIPEIERVRTVLNLTEIYILSHKMDSATYYQQLAQPLLANIKDNELLLFGYETFHNYYLEEGNTLKAKEYFDLYIQMQNIIFEQNEAQKLFSVTKEVQIQHLKSSQKEYDNVLRLLIVLAVLVLGILAFVSNRMRMKGQTAINQQKEEIEKLRDAVKSFTPKKN